MAEAILQISYSLANINNDVHQFWQCVHHHRILAFSGDMGAGKTTFIHALCDFLGVKDHVSSPTFALINEYHFDSDGNDKLIYHMDLYRIKDSQEAVDAGLEDALNNPEAYCFIEWPEKAIDILPLPYLWIDIELITENTRMMRVYQKG
jgi:tRNA threonylcarbamoyladenosine biosynthesis protein TsaE